MERARQLGVAIYLIDKASAIGSDAVVAHARGRRLPEVRGWVTLREGDASGRPSDTFQVLFFGTAPERRILFKVRVPFRAGAHPQVTVVDPPEAPGPFLLGLIRARQTALKAIQPVAQPQNPVLLPGAVLGGRGHAVFLLAGTTRPKLMVLGRHHRVLVSADGTQVLRLEPLSKSVLEIPLDGCGGKPCGPGEQPVGVGVSHLISATPIETHVVASLLNQTPIFVATSRGNWKVDGDKITFLGPRP